MSDPLHQGTELKPCPFCGCEGFLADDRKDSGFWVTGCNAGQESDEGDMTCRANAIGFSHLTREGAIAAWNRRTPEESVGVSASGAGEALERLEEDIEELHSEHGFPRTSSESLGDITIARTALNVAVQGEKPREDAERLSDEELLAVRQAANAQFWRMHPAIQEDYRRVQRGEVSQIDPEYKAECDTLERALDKIDNARQRRRTALSHPTSEEGEIVVPRAWLTSLAEMHWSMVSVPPGMDDDEFCIVRRAVAARWNGIVNAAAVILRPTSTEEKTK